MKKTLYLVFLLISFSFIASPNLYASNDNNDADNEVAERIKRQLELANQMREQRLKKQREKEKQLEIEENIKKRCVKIKDDLRRFSERRRWYTLDEKGERVFLSDKDVDAKRQSLQKQYERFCEES